MTAETALAGAAPGLASPAIRDREPPDWLRAQKLTPARARELLADLESPCPGEDADAQRRHSDAQAKKFALLVFSMGAANAPASDATPARSNEGSSPGGSKKEEDASDAFAAAVASCASHPDGDVRVLVADALVAIAEREPKAAAPHVDALVGLLRYPEDVSLALAARPRHLPRLCETLAAAAMGRAAPSAHAHDAFDILAAALNARGDEAFARNASARSWWTRSGRRWLGGTRTPSPRSSPRAPRTETFLTSFRNTSRTKGKASPRALVTKRWSRRTALCCASWRSARCGGRRRLRRASPPTRGAGRTTDLRAFPSRRETPPPAWCVSRTRETPRSVAS